MFSQEIYLGRRERLSKNMKGGIAFFPCNNEAPMSYPANCYRFRQDSTFNYFFGLLEPMRMAGIIDFDKNETILFGEDYTIDDIIWMGPQPTIKELAERSGIADSRPYDELATYLKKALKEGREIHYLPPYRHDNQILVSKLLGIKIDDVCTKASQALIHEVVELRAVKGPEEIEEMEKICNVGREMELTAMRNCRAGLIEQQLTGMVEGVAISGGEGTSFATILSQNGQTLHNPYHRGRLTNGRLLLVDLGAESHTGYSSDYTRTFPVSGKFSKKQKEVYEIVLRANLESIGMARPGIPYWDVHLNACTIIAEGLTRLGLMKGDPKEAAKAGAHALFMPHGLGHMLGLDTHDMENLGENNVGYDNEIKRSSIFGHASLRCGRRLKPGFIVTVEPGIYFIPELIEKWEKEGKFTEYINYKEVRKYIGFGGIRIEDDILITEDGCRVLGKPLPKTVAAVEAVMRAAAKARQK